ncbi:hypothetical protein [Citrobacter freundii]|uniref:hypothetical protein n=1 Tax=Citrobacter freundii TaxID=546 RepID=UPI001BCAE83F|nr:hypothetical protein [Citrobacter freundii]
MTTNNHPAHGPVSLDRLHQISEILSKAAAQSDGGNLGYAMADAVKVIDVAIAAFGTEPQRNPVLAYADSYRDMAKRGVESIPVWSVITDLERNIAPLYTAPTAQVVPTFDEWLAIRGNKPLGWVKDAMRESYDACRAAMIQSGNSPVIPDDVLRMDWLVSKTVDVREPMVYGSHSIFWSQTITDEYDDYHATKLRGKIDAAMAAEQAAAPHQEVNRG